MGPLNINIGILGHVDSGKTSLVKALSTSLSTAALDKNPQSQQRGITIDLGFSAFQLPIPPFLTPMTEGKYDALQFTLVDCPGHASLIKTIIGGAQIIDMMILVVDANKGIQAQTTECIVIGEITTDRLVIVLNKVDMIPEEERASRIEKVSRRIRRVFSFTKFENSPIIAAAAAIGGEKVASVGAFVSKINGTNAKGTVSQTGNSLATLGMDALIEQIQHSVFIPQRSPHAPLYYSIDHCFAIKGHGTVLTGTVLNGCISVGDTVEFPDLQLQRKVKSMQMFHKSVKYVQQGDRVGMCVTNLDPTLLERGIASKPSSVPLLTNAICMVKKVRFFKQTCKSNVKYHVTIGHNTLIANVTFFGTAELQEHLANEVSASDAKVTSNFGSSVASTTSDMSGTEGIPAKKHLQNSFPVLEYPWYEDMEYNDTLAMNAQTSEVAPPPSYSWALLQFQRPVYCPVGSLIIGSRLDLETDASGDANRSASATAPHLSSEYLESSKASSANRHCRIAFYGPIKSVVPAGAMTANSAFSSATGASNTSSASQPSYAPPKIEKASAASQSKTSTNGGTNPPQLVRVFTRKQKGFEIFRATTADGNGATPEWCPEVIAWKLSTRSGGGTGIVPFLGMQVETVVGGYRGFIHSAFGAAGKFKVRFYGKGAFNVNVGDRMVLKYKKFMLDGSKNIYQDDLVESVVKAGAGTSESKVSGISLLKPLPSLEGTGVVSSETEEASAASYDGEDGDKSDAATCSSKSIGVSISKGTVYKKVLVPDTIVPKAPTLPPSSSPSPVASKPVSGGKNDTANNNSKPTSIINRPSGGSGNKAAGAVGAVTSDKPAAIPGGVKNIRIGNNNTIEIVGFGAKRLVKQNNHASVSTVKPMVSEKRNTSKSTYGNLNSSSDIDVKAPTSHGASYSPIRSSQEKVAQNTLTDKQVKYGSKIVVGSTTMVKPVVTSEDVKGRKKESTANIMVSKASSGSSGASSNSISAFPPGSQIRIGILESFKDDSGMEGWITVVKDAFGMEDNIRGLYIGSTVRGPNNMLGVVIGPFAKMGKCKVQFAQMKGEPDVSLVGCAVEILIGTNKSTL